MKLQMSRIIKEVKDTLKETLSTTWTLLKIMIPISIIIKLLSGLGFVDIIGNTLSPFMEIVGLSGELGLVWGAAMITNIYGGLLAFSTLAISHSYSVAEVTVLATIILIAHTLPIELRIAQKAGVRLWYMLALRIGTAFMLGWILNKIFTTFNLYNDSAKIIWNPGKIDPSITGIIINELKNYALIFLIILGLMLLIKLLKISGFIDKLNNLLEPGLEFLGMSKQSAPVAIIGMTLGLSYGGGILLNETKSGKLTKKDIFMSFSLMGLSHSLIEDTLLMLSIGASIYGILIGRLILTIAIMLILIKIISKISRQNFQKYLIAKPLRRVIKKE
ncbi:MAG: hypothetical protein JXA91_07880 [Candidatus Thermoplasmatota archaeon]|nr:hypothetical protein [Candidatus Thermoplasmatota archaeon]